MTSEVESALNDVGLATLLLIFISDKVDGNIILAGSDQELMCLGISTIGNRCRLRDISRGRRYYKHNFIQQIEPVLVPSSRSITAPVLNSNIETHSNSDRAYQTKP